MEARTGLRRKDATPYRLLPDHLYTELTVALVLLITLSALATALPATLGPPADPLTTPEEIKPEWFFYPMFRWLKLFSGTVAILTMAAALFVSLSWSFVERVIAVPASSAQCVECHTQVTPGLVDHWEGSTHAAKGIGCVECHAAQVEDADHFVHWGNVIATTVTPRDCAQCHHTEAAEFAASHHADGGNILASLDNFLAETVEGSRLLLTAAPTPEPARADLPVSECREGAVASESVLFYSYLQDYRSPERGDSEDHEPRPDHHPETHPRGGSVAPR